MRRPLDDEDWAMVTTREFVADVILMVLGVVALIVICALVIVTQIPQTHP